MFSGIIEAIGTVATLERHAEDATLTIHGGLAPASLEIGESIATNGVCLTVRRVDVQGFVADASVETLRRTTLGDLLPGDPVNLERSLRVGDRVSGHFVFGHVDTIGEVAGIEREGDGWRFRFAFPTDFAPFATDKGSVAVDGISLTMCDCDAASFSVAVIPHTAEVTTLGRRRVGDRVNLEADMLARYVRRALAIGN